MHAFFSQSHPKEESPVGDGWFGGRAGRRLHLTLPYDNAIAETILARGY